MAQDAQDAPKMAQDSPKMAQDAPKMPQDGPKMAPRCPKMTPKWPQDGPKCLSHGSHGDLPPFLGPAECAERLNNQFVQLFLEKVQSTQIDLLAIDAAQEALAPGVCSTLGKI